MSIVVDNSLHDALFSLPWFREDYLFTDDAFDKITEEDVENIKLKVAAGEIESLLLEVTSSDTPEEYNNNLSRVLPFSISANVLFARWMQSSLVSLKTLIAIINTYGFETSESGSGSLVSQALTHKNLSTSYIDYLVGDDMPKQFYIDLFRNVNTSTLAFNKMSKNLISNTPLWETVFLQILVAHPNAPKNFLLLPFEQFKSAETLNEKLLQAALLNPNVTLDLLKILEDASDVWLTKISVVTKFNVMEHILAPSSLFLKVLNSFNENDMSWLRVRGASFEIKLDNVLKDFNFDPATLEALPFEMKLRLLV